MTTPALVQRQRPLVCALSAMDSSGHAGHSCDLRVIQDLGARAVSVVSGLTAQNSVALLQREACSADSLQQQWQALNDDLTLAACKVGLLFDAQQVQAVANFARQTEALVIVDPVLSTSTGSDLSSSELLAAWPQLLAAADLVTPNIPEAELLTGRTITGDADVVSAARRLRELGAAAVLIKGGHRTADSAFVRDYFEDARHSVWLRQRRQSSPHTRGTGCVLSTAIATFVAQGKALLDAVTLASAYVHKGIEQGFALGQGPGLLANTGWPQQLEYFPVPQPTPSSESDLAAYPDCDGAIGVYPIVDSLAALQRVLEAGIDMVQLRIKQAAPQQLNQIIARGVQLARDYQARLVINDHWQLAIEHGAWGVHLGQEDLTETALQALHQHGLRLGLSAHSEFEWLRAAAFSPSYIALGAVFASRTKPTVQAIGVEQLQDWCRILSPHFPVVAIGGIDTHNAGRVWQAGVSGIAVISALDVADAGTARALIRQLQAPHAPPAGSPAPRQSPAPARH